MRKRKERKGKERKGKKILDERFTKTYQDQANIYNYGLLRNNNNSPEVSATTTKRKSEEINAIKINLGADDISNHDDILGVNNEPDTRFKRLNSKSSKPSHNNLPNEETNNTANRQRT